VVVASTKSHILNVDKTMHLNSIMKKMSQAQMQPGDAEAFQVSRQHLAGTEKKSQTKPKPSITVLVTSSNRKIRPEVPLFTSKASAKETEHLRKELESIKKEVEQLRKGVSGTVDPHPDVADVPGARQTDAAAVGEPMLRTGADEADVPSDQGPSNYGDSDDSSVTEISPQEPTDPEYYQLCSKEFSSRRTKGNGMERNNERSIDAKKRHSDSAREEPPKKTKTTKGYTFYCLRHYLDGAVPGKASDELVAMEKGGLVKRIQVDSPTKRMWERKIIEHFPVLEKTGYEFLKWNYGLRAVTEKEKCGDDSNFSQFLDG